MLSIVVPAAGRGSRFKQAGYEKPKPLIDVKGKPMLQRVLENITPGCPHHITVVCLKEHYDEMKQLNVDRLVTLDEVTGGAAITARYGVGSNKNMYGPVMVANSDQILFWDVNDFLKNAEGAAGQVALFKSDGTKKWSHAVVQGHRVTHISEKDLITPWATCGVYWWRDVETFRYSTDCLIKNEEKTNGEYYLAPAMNHLSYVRAYWTDGMAGLGTPEDLEAYVS